ncbi:TIGR02556 family CRISPR-associated protein [Isachenkonia alkalipeptolytica]|uniref:TIGR02556 family CRISPR-associated protein n=1 Tax=Isachenkonia alkalipeptolytica TaxID=2565777 RepID=A0AA44BEC5_9CLOT|nr:TIGR02556 family CRISPR-associated protein [Isachenkonia alkalipeptolytica]NBG87371.1 TIGR02556 family CRISPR-associated protein [Isachenkonia alkalipeptolytica]
MLEHVKNIGGYILSANAEESVVDHMVNTINSDTMETIVEVLIEDGKISLEPREFERNIASKALFYQKGNGVLGGGVRLDYYFQEDNKGEYKGRSKLKKACEFCEVGQYYEEIQEAVEAYLKERSSEAFLILLVDGLTPREKLTEKFLKKMYETMFNQLDGEHVCHLCGEEGIGYNTGVYRFYTNDKEVYGNIDVKEKSGLVLGKDCLEKVLLGKRYVEKELSVYWKSFGKNVMFLPHGFDDEMEGIFQLDGSLREEEKKESTHLLERLNTAEELVLEDLAKGNAAIDILFYEDDGKAFKLDYQIQSIMPSRFGYLAERLKHYNQLKLFMVLRTMSAVKVTLDSIENTSGEKLKCLDAVFSGRPMERNTFFKRAMAVYKHHEMKGEKKFRVMEQNHKIYNFLCDCGVLEKGWNTMKTYHNYEELFEENPTYFDSDEKKAWFILGRCFNYMIYQMKKGKNAEEGEDNRVSLEKGFFFSRKFDFKDFIYFSNQISDKAEKYKVHNSYLKNMQTQAKELMAERERKLSNDEAKYLFFWGKDAYFDKQNKNVVEEEQ